MNIRAFFLFIAIILSSVCNADPPHIERDTIKKICRYVDCHYQLDEFYQKYYFTKTFHKVLAISYYKNTRTNRYTIDYFGVTNERNSVGEARRFALKSCNTKGKKCEVLLRNNSIENEYLYKLLIKKPIVVPSNAVAFGNSFKCISGFKKSGNSCIKKSNVVPSNAVAFGDSFKCNFGFKKSGNSCIKIIPPANAYLTGFESQGWKCYSGFKQYGNSCVKNTVVNNTSSSSSSNTTSSSRVNNTNSDWSILWIIAGVFLIFKLLFRKKNVEPAPKPIVVAKKKEQVVITKPIPKPKPAVAAKKSPQTLLGKKREINKQLKNGLITKRTADLRIKKAIEAEKMRLIIEKNRNKPYKKKVKPKTKRKRPPLPTRKPRSAKPSIKKAKVVIPKPKNKIPPKPIKVPPSHFAPGSTKGFKIINFEQGSKNWLKWRHEGIGASNAPTIMGDNRFETAEELLYQKKNKIDTEPNEQMLLGIKLEPKARELYIKETGIKVKPQCVQDNKFPWLIASMDGISDDLQHIIEIKCGRSAYWQARKGIVPDYYYGQLQHTMMITRLYKIDYWCYWPGERGILQTVGRDDSYIKLLFKAEQAFYKRLVS